MESVFPTRVKLAPQLSVNKLAEYLSTSNPGRRRKILKDSKLGTFFGGDYRLAQLEMQKLIGNPPYAAADIGKVLWDLRRMYPNATPRQLDSARGALAAFQSNFGVLQDLQEMQVLENHGYPDAVTLEGLRISLRPDVVFVHNHPKKGARLGAIKFWFTKSIPESEEIGEFVASLMHHCLGRGPQMPSLPIAPELCIAFDVHRGQRTHAPRSYKRRLEQVKSGCKEIVAVWETI